LFGNDVLIIGVNVALFFQGKDFIIRLGMVGGVMAVVIGSFFLLVAFFPFAAENMSDNGGCVAGCFDYLCCFGSCDLVGGCGRDSCCSGRCDGRCWHLLLLDFKGRNIQHLNVCGADGRSKRTLHCGDYFHCIGFGFLVGIDSDFWLVAVATCYYPDDRFLAFSWLLAV
jgi:hypothetical protein